MVISGGDSFVSGRIQKCKVAARDQCIGRASRRLVLVLEQQ
jgi:hypothetical protein